MRKSKSRGSLAAIRRDVRRDWQLYLLLLVPIVYIIIFKYLPMGGLVIAFKNYKVRQGIWGSKWVGFDQFTNARIQNVTTTERNDVVESFLIYGETDTDYYVIYAVGDDMSFLAHYDELYQYAQTLKPQ